MKVLEFIAHIFNYVLIGLVALCVLLYFIRIIYVFYGFAKLKKEKPVNSFSSFCILIPARNESRVIRNILNAVKGQDYDKSKITVYVIVEDINDPTVNIVKEFGYNYYVRPDLENKRTKGWALDQCIHDIFNRGETYDSFVIFDADNIPQNDFLSYLNRARINNNLKMGFGNRQSTNYNYNVISMCSSIMFQMVNIFGNKGKSRFIHKVILSGTGYFIDYDLIKEAGGFIWHGLCEDTELCIYLYAKEVRCGYIDEAIFYDEQPTQYFENLKQHTRWFWGNIFADIKQRPLVLKSYFKSKEDKLAKIDYLVSNVPIAVMVIFAFVNAFFQIAVGISHGIFYNEPLNLFIVCGVSILIGFYLLFTLISALVVFLNRKHYQKASIGLKIGSCLLFFFYMADFLTAFIRGLSKKNRSWNTINHVG